MLPPTPRQVLKIYKTQAPYEYPEANYRYHTGHKQPEYVYFLNLCDAEDMYYKDIEEINETAVVLDSYWYQKSHNQLVWHPNLDKMLSEIWIEKRLPNGEWIRIKG